MSWFRDTIRKLGSEAMGAPRLVNAAATGKLKGFKLFDRKPLSESIKESFKGKGVALTLVTSGLGLFRKSGSNTDMVGGNQEGGLLGGLLGGGSVSGGNVTGGITFGQKSNQSFLLPVIIIFAVVL